MVSLRAAIALGLWAALTLGSAQAEDAFDDPSTSGSVPCIVLNRYQVAPVAPPQAPPLYRGEAVIENICGRAMEVHFCFLRAEPLEGADRSCFQGALRPWAVASVEETGAPSRITAPEYNWRFLRR